MPGIVEQADEVSIVMVCQLIGMDEVTGDGRATKYHCPFSEFYHSKPEEKAFRVYTETNSSFCFGGCGFFTPVMLYAKANDFVTKDDKLRLRDAAAALLKAVGYVEPTQSSWDALTNPQPSPVNIEALGKALDRLLARSLKDVPEDSELESRALRVYDQLRALLPKIKSGEDASNWMDVADQAISAVIEGGQGDPRSPVGGSRH